MNSRADLSITMTNRVNGRSCTTLTNRLAGDTDAEVGATKRRLGERYAARIGDEVGTWKQSRLPDKHRSLESLESGDVCWNAAWRIEDPPVGPRLPTTGSGVVS